MNNMNCLLGLEVRHTNELSVRDWNCTTAAERSSECGCVDIPDTRSDNYVPILLITVGILPRRCARPGEVPRTAHRYGGSRVTWYLTQPSHLSPPHPPHWGPHLYTNILLLSLHLTYVEMVWMEAEDSRTMIILKWRTCSVYSLYHQSPHVTGYVNVHKAKLFLCILYSVSVCPMSCVIDWGTSQ